MMRTGSDKLKGLRAALAGCAAGLIAALIAPGDVQAAATGIAATRHNLSSSAPAGNNTFDGTNEVCVFCHTPHGSNTAVAAPLWNKATPASSYSVYSTSVSSTIDGQIATGGIGSVSIACLSCHDGSQAMNNMINQPGSGGYNASGANMSGSWTAGTGPTPVNTGTGILGSGVGNLGANLVNDHPISIQYCGGGYTVASGSGSGPNPNGCNDADFVSPSSTVIAGTRVFWVETGGNANRNKTDMILYNRDFGGTQGPAVECASCHDPHVDGTGGSGPTFLRIANAGSALCLSCHVK
jgi:predicted CXXCH cytochrome family protein